MKTIVLVLVAALALVGAAAAWDSTDTLSVVGGKTAYIQAGDPAASFAGFTTYGGYVDAASSNDIDPWATNAQLSMKLVQAKDNPVCVAGATSSQTDTLTQIGTAKVVTRAPDTQDGLPEQDASYSTWQNMNFCGASYKPGSIGLGTDRGADMVAAEFASEGSVTVNGYTVGSTTEPEGAINAYDAIGAIEGQAGTTITGANIGVASTTGFTNNVDANGAFNTPLVSGSTQAWAGFTGGVLNGGYIQSNTGMYETTVGAGTMPQIGNSNPYPSGFPSW